MTPEIAVKIHFPFLRLRHDIRVHVLVVIFLGIRNPGIIKRFLHLHDIIPRVAHRFQPEFFRNQRRHRLSFIRRRIFLQKRDELFTAPLPRLFDCRFTAARHQQPQKILEILRHRVHAVTAAIHRADREHLFTKPTDKAVMNSVAPRPADNRRAFWGAKIHFICISPKNPQRQEVNPGFEKTLIKFTHFSINS